MNFSNLVERMVPLVAELFATLKVNDPLRMDFADIAEKTIYDIVEVLRAEGLTNEEIAASLDLSIAGFYRKLKDLRETYASPGTNGQERRGTLWERIYGFLLRETGGAPGAGVRYTAIEREFGFLTPDRLGSILRYLVKFGRLSVSGHGASASYRIVVRERAEGASYHDAVVMLYRDGPLALAELGVRLEQAEDRCAEWIERLRAAGRLETTTPAGGEPAYRAISYHIEPDSAVGYEAALWDHFQAVCRAICKKIRLADSRHASMGDVIGGTTFSFDLDADSPLYAEISGFLAESRARMEAWYERAMAEQPPGRPAAEDERRVRVTIYTGQMVEDLE